MEIPPAVARRLLTTFVPISPRECNQARRDRRPANVLLREYQGPREKPVRIPDAVTKRAKKAGGDWEVEEF
jgi:hypothetical protein